MWDPSASSRRKTSSRPRASSPALHKTAAALVILAAFLACTVYYILWRVAIVNWWFWWIGGPLLLAEMFGILNSLGLQYTVWPRPAPEINSTEDPTQIPIYILIPTVNEGVGILEPTVRGALATRARYLEHHPDAQVSVVLCNDGRVAGVRDWAEVESLAERMGVACVTRTIPGGAKAGNIEYARQTVGAVGNALIALFDADMAAEPEFLLKTVAPFADPTVGWVQTGQYYRNRNNAVARWAHDQQILFYRLICVGKAAVNGAFICGTNVVIRAAALDTIGGLPQNTVTEDLAASILLHPNWRSLYLTDVLAQGLGPEDLGAYFSQQRRWATGTFGVLFRHWRMMLLPWHRGLTTAQRLQYLYCCGHFFSGFRDFVCLAAPLAYLCLGLTAFRAFTLSSFLTHFLPYWAFSLFIFWYATRGKAGFRAILHGSILGFGCFPVFIASFVGVLFKQRLGFVITAKRRQEASGWQHLSTQGVLLLACLVGMARFALLGIQGWLGMVSELWMLYMVLLLSGMLWLGIAEDPAAEQALLRRGRRLRPVFIGCVTLVAGLFVSQHVLGVIQTSRLAPDAPAADFDTHSIRTAAGRDSDLLWADGSTQSLTYTVNARGQVIGITENGGHPHDLLWPFRVLCPASPQTRDDFFQAF